jgi:hypothetical protein
MDGFSAPTRRDKHTGLVRDKARDREAVPCAASPPEPLVTHNGKAEVHSAERVSHYDLAGGVQYQVPTLGELLHGLGDPRLVGTCRGTDLSLRWSARLRRERVVDSPTYEFDDIVVHSTSTKSRPILLAPASAEGYRALLEPESWRASASSSTEARKRPQRLTGDTMGA